RIALSIPIAGVVVYFTTAGRQARPPAAEAPAVHAAAPPAASAPASDAALAAVEPAAPPLTGAAASGPLTTTIAVKRPSWVSATVDRKSTRLNSSHEWISYAVF